MLSISQSQRYKRSIWISVVTISTWICTWQFYAVWWLFLLLPYTIVFLAFIIEFIGSLHWGIISKKTCYYPFLPLHINLITFLVIFSWPSVHQTKRYPKFTHSLCEQAPDICACHSNLYVDYYLAGTGFLAADLNAVYLTDRKNFRLYVGTYLEDNQEINIHLNGDHITTVKTTTEGISTLWTDKIILEKRIFSLIYLEQNHVFQ